MNDCAFQTGECDFQAPFEQKPPRRSICNFANLIKLERLMIAQTIITFDEGGKALQIREIYPDVTSHSSFQLTFSSKETVGLLCMHNTSNNGV